jgi:hypothetical protein
VDVTGSEVADTVTKQVDTELGNVGAEHFYERPNGTMAIGRLFGNDVNHHTMPWWVYGRQKTGQVRIPFG